MPLPRQLSRLSPLVMASMATCKPSQPNPARLRLVSRRTREIARRDTSQGTEMERPCHHVSVACGSYQRNLATNRPQRGHRGAIGYIASSHSTAHTTVCGASRWRLHLQPRLTPHPRAVACRAPQRVLLEPRYTPVASEDARLGVKSMCGCCLTEPRGSGCAFHDQLQNLTRRTEYSYAIPRASRHVPHCTLDFSLLVLPVCYLDLSGPCSCMLCSECRGPTYMFYLYLLYISICCCATAPPARTVAAYVAQDDCRWRRPGGARSDTSSSKGD